MVNFQYSKLPTFDYNSVVYGENGGFIAVGYNGVSRSIDDGITWTTVNFPESLYGAIWNSITYAEGLYVAVGINNNNNGVLMTSPDGVIWTDRSDNIPDGLYNNSELLSVTYGTAGGFVVIGDVDNVSKDNRVMTSPDGITWTDTTSGIPVNIDKAYLNSITYGDSGYVAVGENNNYYYDYYGAIMTSQDGITWIDRTGNIPEIFLYIYWNSVTYGNGQYIAVGDDNAVMTSLDGIDWIDRSDNIPETINPSTYWLSITYGGGQYVAVGDENGSVMTSPNGIDWTHRDLGIPEDLYYIVWRSVIYGNGQYVAVSHNSVIMSSPTGVTWTDKSLITCDWRSITYAEGLYVAVGNNNNGGLMTSPDGINWSDRSDNIPEGLYNYTLLFSVTYGSTGGYVVIGYNYDNDDSNRVMTSPNGIDWTDMSDNIPGTLKDAYLNLITYGSTGGYVAIGRNNALMTSPNGIIWTDMSDNIPDTIDSSTDWRSITYGSTGGYVAVSQNDIVMASPNGIDWTDMSNNIPEEASNINLNSITYGANGYVIIGNYTYGDYNRFIMTSPDGIEWTISSITALYTGLYWEWNSLIYADGQYVATFYGDTNGVIASLDGINWVVSNFPKAYSYTSASSIVYSNGRFVTVGYENVALYSYENPGASPFRLVTNKRKQIKQ